VKSDSNIIEKSDAGINIDKRSNCGETFSKPPYQDDSGDNTIISDNGRIKLSPQPYILKTECSSISAGHFHNCAILLPSNGLLCWGGNDHGESSVPNLPFINLASDVSNVSAGWGHTCSTQSDGLLHCWGYNRSGQTDIPILLVLNVS